MGAGHGVGWPQPVASAAILERRAGDGGCRRQGLGADAARLAAAQPVFQCWPVLACRAPACHSCVAPRLPNRCTAWPWQPPCATCTARRKGPHRARACARPCTRSLWRARTKMRCGGPWTPWPTSAGARWGPSGSRTLPSRRSGWGLLGQCLGGVQGAVRCPQAGSLRLGHGWREGPGGSGGRDWERGARGVGVRAAAASARVPASHNARGCLFSSCAMLTRLASAPSASSRRCCSASTRTQAEGDAAAMGKEAGQRGRGAAPV